MYVYVYVYIGRGNEKEIENKGSVSTYMNAHIENDIGRYW